jgi:hypothetical protein
MVWPGQRWLRDCCRVGANVITSPEVVMRMSVVREVGGQMPLSHSHDMEMWMRVAAFSDVGYVEGADQAWHREHDASLSAREVDRYRDLCERKAAFETLFSGRASIIPRADQLKAAAYRALASAAMDIAASDHDHGRNDRQEADRYLAFAGSCVADLKSVPGWRSLQWRLRPGHYQSGRHPVFLVQRLLRRLRAELRSRNWHRFGMF